MSFIFEHDKICRACLASSEPLRDLFSVCSPEVFEFCTSVEISASDELPKMICQICLDLLNKLFYFKQVVVRSNIILREHAPVFQLQEELEASEANLNPDFLDDIETCEKFDDLSDVDLEAQVEGIAMSILEDKDEGDKDKQTDQEKQTDGTLEANTEDVNVPEGTIQDPEIEEQDEVDNKRIRQSEENLEEQIKPVIEKSQKEPEEKTLPLRKRNTVKHRKETNNLTEYNITDQLPNREYTPTKKTFKKRRKKEAQETDKPKKNTVDRLACIKCEKTFRKYENLEAHIRTHFGKSPDIQCAVCKKTFNTTNNLHSHMRVHSGVRKYQCLVCGKSFAYLNVLKKHEKMHAGIKDYPCDICDAKFASLYNLKLHQKTHRKEKSYCCGECGARFVQPGNLKTHLIRHTGIKSVGCDICDMKFFTRGDLKKHMKSHSADRPHYCDICKKHYKSKNFLSIHMRTHTGERPYACDLCPVRFMSRKDCKNHRMIHTGERPHQCELCSHSFIQKCALNRHMKTHLKNMPQQHSIIIEQDVSLDNYNFIIC